MHQRMQVWIAVIVCGAALLPACAASAQDTAAPPAASDYVTTRIEGVRGGLVYGVDIQPSTHDVYVASETMRGGFFGVTHDPANGTWKSDDMGESWQRIGPGGRNVKVSHSDPDVVYANDRYGVYKTTDGGENWTTIMPGGDYRLGYRGLDIYDGDHNVVYAGGRGFLRVSRDGGESWTDFELPEDDEGNAARTQVIQIHPDDPDTAFFAFYDGDGPTGVWKTTDGGKTFTQLRAGGARAMSIARSDPDVIYCSAAVTHDGGETWQSVSATRLAAWMIAVHPTNPDVAYYSRPGRPISATTNGGKLFQKIQGVLANYDGTEVEGMAIDPEHDILWVGGDRIWKGENASSGRIALERADNGFHVISLSDINSVSTGVWTTSDAQGIHYTKDGKTWHTTAMGMHGTDALWRVAPSPSDPDMLYAAHETRLFKSVDGGKSWFMIHGEWYPFCIIDPDDPQVVYFSSRQAKGDMLRSTDGGRTYENLGKGRFLDTRPGASKTIYAEREDGLYISRDRAESFEKVSDESDLGHFFISPGNPDLMLSARGEDGLHKSTDGGRTWSKLELELQSPTRITEAGDGTLWLADPATGLVRSRDGGENWEQVWDSMGDVTADPWDDHSIYMISRGSVYHVHPNGAGRTEQFPEPRDDNPEHKTVDMDEPMFLDRSNTTYRLTRDMELFGITRSLALMPRGLKNVTIDGQGHSVHYTGGSTIVGDDVENITIKNIHFVADETQRPPRALILLMNSRNVTIENCTFDIHGGGRLGTGQAINTSGILTDNVVIENCTFNAPDLEGYVIKGAGRHTIRNNTFTPRSNALQLKHADDSVLEGNDFGDGRVRLLSSEYVLKDNQFENREEALRIGE